MPVVARRMGRDVVTRVATRVGASAMQAAALILVARVLGPEEFGTLAVFAALGAVLNSVLSGGATTRLLRLLAEPAARTTAAALYWVQAVGCGLVLVSLVVAAFVTGNPAPAVVGAVLAFGDQQAEFAVAYLSGLSRQTAASVAIVIQRAIGLGAAGLAVVPGLPVHVVIAAGAVVVGVLATVVSPVRRTDRRALATTLRTSGGYWWSSVVGNLQQLEPVVVGAFGGAAVAGRYAISSRVTNPLNIVVASLRAVAVPELARSRDAEGFRRVFRLLLTVVTVYAVLLVMGSPVIASLFIELTGPEYEGARTLVTVMVVASGLSAVSQALQCRFIAVGQPVKPAWAIACGGSVGLVLLAALSGIDGGAHLWVAPLVTQSIILITMGALLFRSPSVPVRV